MTANLKSLLRFSWIGMIVTAMPVCAFAHAWHTLDHSRKCSVDGSTCLEIKHAIEDDVKTMNIDDPARGHLHILEYAGSNAPDRQMYSPEARVHFFYMLDDIHGAGYYHSQVFVPEMLDLPSSSDVGTNFPDPVVELISKAFAAGNKTIAVILGSDQAHGNGAGQIRGELGHYTVFAVEDSGRVVILDSLSHHSEPLSSEGKKHLLERLNRAKIHHTDKNGHGSEIHFTEVESVTAGQQQGDNNCLIYAVLNAHQIAKTGSIESYHQVTSALASGKLHKYEDIRNIGSLSGDTSIQFESYKDFMLDFRNRTQALIAEITQTSIHQPHAEVTPSKTDSHVVKSRRSSIVEPAQEESTMDFDILKGRIESLKKVRTKKFNPSHHYTAFSEIEFERSVGKMKELYDLYFLDLSEGQTEYINDLLHDYPDYQFEGLHNEFLNEQAIRLEVTRLMHQTLASQDGILTKIKRIFNLRH